MTVAPSSSMPSSSDEATVADPLPPEQGRNVDPDSLEAKEVVVDHDEDIIPDGGYGWVVCAATFSMAATTWGINSVFGVYQSFYRQYNYFPRATDLDYAFIGGLSVATAMLIAPVVNYLTKRFGFRVPMLIGLGFAVLGQIFAGLSKRIWQLFITQGIMFGLGIGMAFIGGIPLLPQWFSKKRSLANGLAAAGSGVGQLVLSITTRLAIQNISLEWAFIINGLITLVVLGPSIFLLRTREAVQATARFEPLEFGWFAHGGMAFCFAWAVLSILAYIIALFSVATYATEGLGLSQAQGADVQAVLAAGQAIGRPMCGFLLDRYGILNMTSLLSLLSGFTCLFIWMFARSYGVLIVFALLQGALGGVIWSSAAPVCATLVGVKHLGSVLGMFWVTIGFPALFAEPIASELIKYSRTALGRQGADAFLICIGFAGGCFVAAGVVLLGAKRWKQGGSLDVFRKT